MPLLLEQKRVFYFEDNPSNRAIMQVILEQSGAIMGFDRWANQNSISKLKAFLPVDLILLDLMFPHGISGYDIFDAIREAPEFAAIPIVAVSASDPAVEIPKSRAKGFNGFISKPVDMTWLPKRLAAILRGEPVWET